MILGNLTAAGTYTVDRGRDMTPSPAGAMVRARHCIGDGNTVQRCPVVEVPPTETNRAAIEESDGA
jgi:hypothetical protein